MSIWSRLIRFLSPDLRNCEEEVLRKDAEIRALEASTYTRDTEMNPNENFREKIFDAYGFTFEARAFIRLHSSVLVDDLNRNDGGGGWIPPTNSVQLASGQHEAAVHEFSHVW